jgi:hypothetical protein
MEVFKYLGRLLADDNTQVIRVQLRKEFYKAVVQAVLLYGSKTWVLSTAALVSLEGFHIRAAYRMAVRHKHKP